MAETPYEEVALEAMAWDAAAELYTYECPCGDLFTISGDELAAGEDIAHCASCSLVLRVLCDADAQKAPSCMCWRSHAGLRPPGRFTRGSPVACPCRPWARASCGWPTASLLQMAALTQIATQSGRQQPTPRWDQWAHTATAVLRKWACALALRRPMVLAASGRTLLALRPQSMTRASTFSKPSASMAARAQTADCPAVRRVLLRCRLRVLYQLHLLSLLSPFPLQSGEPRRVRRCRKLRRRPLRTRLHLPARPASLRRKPLLWAHRRTFRSWLSSSLLRPVVRCFAQIRASTSF